MPTERITRDLCQDDWQDAHPDDYFPNVTRYGTCAECGAEGVLVARSTIADERETPLERMQREERDGLAGSHVNHTTGA